MTILYLLLSAVVFFIILLVLLVLEDRAEDLRKKILYKQFMLALVAVEIVVIWIILEIFSKS